MKNELTFDTFHTKSDRIYRFTVTNPSFLQNAHFARFHQSEQIPDLAEYFPEIESYARLAMIRGGVMMHNEKYYNINEGFICDSTFFELFNVDLLIGNKHTILNEPGSMVVTASFAKKIFGDKNPIGQMISLPAGQFYGEKSDFTVKGVMKESPQNSHFHPDLITTPARGEISWWAFTYLLLHENANPEKITTGYPQFLSKLSSTPAENIQTKAHLQKITDIHLRSDKLREIEANGNMTNIYVLSIAAIILLLISISNYSSLNLGISGFNNKFIAINRVLGSTRNMNLKYFFVESLFINVASIVFAMFIIIPTNIYISNHFGIKLLNENIALTVLIIVLFSLLGMLSGLQPVLKQKISKIYRSNRNLLNKESVVISRGIIISQYVFAMILIASVIVISRQTNFALNNSMGVQKDNIICFESVHASIQQKFEIFKAELLKSSSIEAVSAMMEPPGGEANDMFAFELEGFEQVSEPNQPPMRIGVFPCDYSFANLFSLKFLSGSNFSENNVDVNGSGEYIINETAMHLLNHNNPDEITGKRFKLNSPVEGINIPEGKITGIVKDFHLSSIKNKVNPLVLFKRDKLWLINFVVSFKPGKRKAALFDIQKVWEEIFPSYPFNYEHVGAMYRNVYKTELLQARLLTIFTIISLFISSMGLLGISLLVSQQRVKEIGIRKVNGADVSEILTMLNKDFVKWVAIAFAIACPVTYYAMNKWLENFAYKTNLSWWVFVLAGLSALVIVLLTVSWQSWKAATRNPVEALRYE